MTSVRNSYIVLSSFPAFASSPHSPLKLSPLADYQTASISLLHVIFFLLESCLSMREQRMKTAPLSPATLRCISQPGNVQTAVFPTSLLRLPGSPTHPSVPPPSPNKSATVPLYTQTFHPPLRPHQQYNLNE